MLNARLILRVSVNYPGINKPIGGVFFFLTNEANFHDLIQCRKRIVNHKQKGSQVVGLRPPMCRANYPAAGEHSTNLLTVRTHL